jgi:hypothetical protein
MPSTNTTSSELLAQDALVQLQAWAAHHTALTTQIEKLQAVVGAMPDCPLLASMYEVWNAYSKLIAEKVGDQSEWLEYFEHECHMGKTPKEVSWLNPSGDGQISVTVDSVEALLKVLGH